jgi:type IV pilus assembly protein PilA
MRNKGFTLIELMIVVAIIGILALIAIPNFINLRQKAYDASARSAGRNAKLAEEVYYNDRTEKAGNYTTALSTLLTIDKNLTDDAAVTFSFIAANISGFTLYTQHQSGSGAMFTYKD